MSDYTVQTVDLSSAHDPGTLVGGEDPPGRRVLVPEAPDTAYIRIGSDPEDGDEIPLLGGFEDCLEPGERVYVSNPEGSGTLRVVFTDDADLELGDVAPPQPTGTDPVRLGDPLTGSFSDGDDATVTVDVTGVRRLDLRALVTGISSLSNISTSTPFGTQENFVSAVKDPENDRAFVLADSAELYEVDLSDPEAPTVAASITLSGFTDRVNSLEIDRENDVLLATGTEGGVNADTRVNAVDVSTVGTPSQVDSLELSNSGGFESDTELVGGQAVLVGSQDGAWLVDYSTPSNLSSVSTTPTAVPVLYYNSDQGVAYGTNNQENIVRIDVRGTSSIAELGTDPIPDPEGLGWGQDTTPEGLYDEGRNLWFLQGSDGNNDDAVHVVQPFPSGVDFVAQENTPSQILNGEVDTASQRIVASDNGSRAQLLTYGVDSLTHVAALSVGNSNSVTFFGFDFDRIHHPYSDTWEVWDTDLGSDVLELQPLDPAGSPIGAQRVTATLEDGIEALVTLRTVGIGQVDVTHKARSGTGGTRDYFDAYREDIA